MADLYDEMREEFLRILGEYRRVVGIKALVEPEAAWKELQELGGVTCEALRPEPPEGGFPTQLVDVHPLAVRNPLSENGKDGSGFDWSGISLEVRQLAYFVVQSLGGELRFWREVSRGGSLAGLYRAISQNDPALMRREYPAAASWFDDARKTGKLPTLKTLAPRI